MQPIDRELVEQDVTTGVILSPRNYSREQIERHAKEIRDLGGPVLFDPQFYQPRTDRQRILDYPYWNGMSFETVGFADNGARQLCEGVVRYQVDVLNVAEVILPGRFSNAATDDWLEMQYALAEKAAEMDLDRPVYSTLALGPDVVLESQLLDRVLNDAVAYPVDGIYVVLYPPNGQFLVLNDVYIYNLLSGFLSLALSGKSILLGYANQQSLVYAAAGVTGLASGNFRNVRSFDPQNFEPVGEPGDRQRATWYYDGNTLSEFRPQALGLAYARGLGGSFGPQCTYCRPLLEANNPATVPWGERSAFRHYLTEIRRQWLAIGDIPRSRRPDYVGDLLKGAQKRLQDLKEKGFRVGERSFDLAFEPTLTALTAFKADRQTEIEML